MHIFYRFAPPIIVAAGIIILIIGKLLLTFTGLQDSYVWFFLFILIVITGFFCGKLIQKLSIGVYQDHLIGVKSRRYFYERLTTELIRLDRTKGPLSLLMIDIDTFKSINDTFGHSIGDQVLKQLGSILLSNIRQIDTVARWGGEEFAIILPETSAEGVLKLAERLKNTVEKLDFPYKFTISIGITTTSTNVDVDHLVMLADTALYKAKEKRNQVVVL